MPTKKISKIIEAEPPPRSQSPYDWEAIAAQVKAKPGTWFKIFENDKVGYAVSMRNGDNTHLSALKGFEIRTSNNKPGSPRTCDLWLRYTKPKGAK